MSRYLIVQSLVNLVFGIGVGGSERIDRLDYPRVAAYRDLPASGARRAAGTFIVEGRLLLEKVLSAQSSRLVSTLLTEAMLTRVGAPLAAASGPPVYVAREETLQGVVGFAFHGGCVALAERISPPDADALLAARFLVVLERVTNPDNVGGVFRNAMAFGAGGVLLSSGCADPLGRKALRASVGGVLHVPFAAAPDWPGALDRLKTAGFRLLALTPRTDAVDITALAPVPAPIALLFGTDENGLRAATLAAADLAVRIPMAPGAAALNVVTAAGIALHRLSGLA